MAKFLIQDRLDNGGYSEGEVVTAINAEEAAMYAMRSIYLKKKTALGYHGVRISQVVMELDKNGDETTLNRKRRSEKSVARRISPAK